MKQYEHPPADAFELTAILHALADPYRLSVVRRLAQAQPQPCAPLQAGRPKSSTSHHFMVLRKAGIVRTEVVGTTHMNSLRDAELEARFPGLLATVLKAAAMTPLEACVPAAS
ncbi:ArsR family transcriptional regulator [Acetobacter tropicalis NRIC 0312]|uniref:Transcriptional regulator n=1 Tax=Acetobacter tropicalis TaxID=104102 RepID=A0A511FJ82_9PROT|nr:helix-turn-helix transcriptional regulator [Acetobacter tropicalis]KXV45578.1 ArsR family transcriptional regulator [Acetobacter tropicalis]GBR71749.1 ArsR family transcriptional regulator [Acetobacter tropicalis NRIC 0312]GEL49291.1 transcriptional regulator [Acetobacter tropicalis]